MSIAPALLSFVNTCLIQLAASRKFFVGCVLCWTKGARRRVHDQGGATAAILLQTNHIVRAIQIQQIREKQTNGSNVPVTEAEVVSNALHVSIRLYFRLPLALFTRAFFFSVVSSTRPYFLSRGHMDLAAGVMRCDEKCSEEGRLTGRVGNHAWQ